MSRSKMNKAILLGATQPIITAMWIALALYAIATQYDGWLFLTIVCLAIASVQIFIRLKLIEEENRK